MARGPAIPPGSRITEVKRRPDGTEQRFECELVHHDPRVTVVRFHVARPLWNPSLGPLDSYGCFWPRRHYAVYHMVRPADGREVVTRYDVLRDLSIGTRRVSYTDLYLDLWTEPARDDRPALLRWEDDDEFLAAEAAGLLSDFDGLLVERTRRVLAVRHRRIVSEVRMLLRQAGRLRGA